MVCAMLAGRAYMANTTELAASNAALVAGALWCRSTGGSPG
jgi:hypothetical protein